MRFTLLMNLALRRWILRIYNLVAPVVSKTGITKMRIKGSTLGSMIYLLFTKILYYKIPDPIENKGIIMFHRIPEGQKQFGWLYAFEYEPETSLVFEQIVKPGMTVVDVGANIGYYTLLAAKLVGNEGKVYAFEPNPSFYWLLQKNIRINALDKIVEAFQVAIGNTESKSILFIGKCITTSLFKVLDSAEQAISVNVISLDKFFMNRGWPSVDVIKVDAEGADKIVLEGIRVLVKRCPELKLIIELDPSYLEAAGTSAEELLILLGELGFNRIRALSGEIEYYNIPSDTQYLINLGWERGYINLLCER
ncbi:MAG: hypothetical protein A2166_03120 [Omnitrophica WOR_2 bacterium RBG_13_41_10]|nr:MAG: hypothetical protein A2166_03120 [Omnitrophica WOR_2 bacterium RBG_13_41_10]